MKIGLAAAIGLATGAAATAQPAPVDIGASMRQPYPQALGAVANYLTCGVQVPAAVRTALMRALVADEALGRAHGHGAAMVRQRHDYDALMAVTDVAACGGGPVAALAAARRALATFRAWALQP